MYDTKNEWIKKNQIWIEAVERKMLEEALKGGHPELPLRQITRILQESCHEVFRLQALVNTLENTIKSITKKPDEEKKGG
jgi:hypothetical protein